MSYTRPLHDAADATWVGAAAYTRNGYSNDFASWLIADPVGYIADSGPLRPPFVRGVVVTEGYALAAGPLGVPMVHGYVGSFGSIVVASMLGEARVLGSHSFYAGRIAVATVLGAPAVVARTVVSGLVTVPSPLGAVNVLAAHDFTLVLAPVISDRYVADLLGGPSGTVRVPISSWQATLQTSELCYVQCVVPAVTANVTAITEATEFTVTRIATLEGGGEYELEMARSALSVSLDRGSRNYTATLSGYPDAFATNENPSTAFDRVMYGIRSISVSSTGLKRCRCAIDWLLRPAQRAYIDGDPIIAAYVNYYVNATDNYMDVGERAV